MSRKLFKSVLQQRFHFPIIQKSEDQTLHKNIPAQNLSRLYSGKQSKSEAQVKKLLNDASPLKDSLLNENTWSTSPYPVGTVFKKLESNENLEDIPEKKVTSVIMFPGQGNQFVGMSNNIIKYPVVKDMFDSANEILGYDLLKLCTSGPASKLNETTYCQAAMLVTSLGALEILKEQRPWAINGCTMTCGFSVGEFAALVFAGCLTFEKALRLVKVRSEAMQLCCKINSGGMLTVLYGPASNLSEAIQDSIAHCKSKGIENAHCSVANYLFEGCKVIAGHTEALNYIINNKGVYRLKKFSKLPVSGAFHTPLMAEAEEIFRVALEKAEVNNPIIKVYSNLDGKPYRNYADIKRKLPKQICHPVKWEQIMHLIFERKPGEDFPFAYECGPGRSLGTILGKINNKAVQNCVQVCL